MDKLITDYSKLSDTGTIDQAHQHGDGMNGNTNFTNLIPDATAFTALITAAEGKSSDYQTAKDALAVLLTQKDDAIRALQDGLSQRAQLCNIQKKGDRVALQTTRLPLVGDRQAAGPTPQVQSLHLTRADSVGKVDAMWDSLLKLAKSYEVSVCINPLNNDPTQGDWQQAATVTASNCTIGSYTSGVRLWVRVRAIGTLGAGDWSDPATIIVP